MGLFKRKKVPILNWEDVGKYYMDDKPITREEFYSIGKQPPSSNTFLIYGFTGDSNKPYEVMAVANTIEEANRLVVIVSELVKEKEEIETGMCLSYVREKASLLR